MQQKDLQARVQYKIFKPADVVFEALTDPDKIINYFVTKASGPIAEGATLTWTFGDVGATVDIKVEKVKKNKEISFIWPATGQGTTVNIVVKPLSDKETEVTVTEKGWAPDAEGIKSALEQTQGWTDFLLCLKAYLEFDINLRRGLKLSTLC
jgi:uncharacterized protein YndB with AHSA1/START domain